MAGIFKKFFGFGHKEETTKKTAEEKIPATGGGGFSVKVAVSADITPVLARCYGHGGVQGLTWYAENLRADDDGDVAQEFLEEVLPSETQGGPHNKKSRLLAFETVLHTKPVKLKGPVRIQDGNVHQSQRVIDWQFTSKRWVLAWTSKFALGL
ncbi:hypothetical protein BDL97_11G055400 [Sphagnum fallax]|uniref:Uncharacterized protein n=2 Tax=Sphagnum jensenii TaxID=128206 RepID=A0ABP0VUM3_9BRYO|nr:hypothetical protein BDL97_11G055400 [Sphagnum fallax]